MQRRSPPCQRGVVWRSQTGGIPRHCLGTSSLITLHYSLKSLPFSTLGCAFKKVPTVNPSVKNQRFLPAPFHKGAFGVQRRSPPGHCGGASAPPRRGDTQALPGYFFPNHASLFPKKPSPFHMGLYFGKVPAVESLSQKSKIFASSLWQGSLFTPGMGGAPQKCKQHPRYAFCIPGVCVFFVKPDKPPEIPRGGEEFLGGAGRGWEALLPASPGGCRPG